jgi:RsmE family RNA methyltransferase
MNIVLFEGEPFFPRGDDRYQHIRKILKKGVGDSFFAGEIDGPQGQATILSMDERGLSFAFRPEGTLRPLHPISLVIGFPRPIQLKRLLRDATSLGARAIYLTGTDLGEKSYRDSTLLDRGAARASLIEGAMQSGGSAIPVLELFDSVDETLRAILPEGTGTSSGHGRGGYPCRVLLDTANPASSLVNSRSLELVSARMPLVLAIGSERGWTARERVLFADSGFETCSLGSRILRTETATTAALAIALAKTGFMEG